MPHICLEELAVNNVGPIRKARLSVKPGLTIIRGRNLDAAAGKNQTNAVGKSLILSPIAMALSGSRPLPVPKRYQNSGPFTTPGASMGVYLHVDKKRVEIHQRQKGKSYELAIISKGKDLGLRTQKIAQERRQKMLPVSEAQFYSTVYLDMRRPPVLQTGTDVQRLEFLSDIFQLNQLDVYKKKVLAVQQELNAKKRDLQLIATEHQSVVTQLQAINWSDKKLDKIDTLRKQQQELTEQVHTWSKRAAQNALAVEQQKARKNAKKFVIEHRKLRDIRMDIMTARSEAAYYSAWKHSNKQVQQLRSKIVELPECPSESAEELEKQLNRLRKQFNQVQLPERAPKKPVGEKLSQEDYNKYFPLSCIDDSDVAESTCPTCGQCVQGLAKKVRAAKTKIDIHNKLIVWEIENKEYQELLEQHRLNEKLTKTGRKLAEKLAIVRAHQNQQQIKDGVAQMEKMMGKKPINRGQNLPTLKKELAAAKKSVQAEKTLAEPIIKSWPRAEQRHKEALDALQHISAKLSKLEQDYSVVTTLTKQKTRLAKQLKIYKDLDKEIEAAAKLSKLLGNKGLKLDIAKDILSNLETVMNDKADLLFVEPVRFKFGTNGSVISMCYQHKHSKTWTDIREMSGQESRAFSLLFFCAVKPYIRNFSTDFVVLDEMDANMSRPTRDLFAKEFLPYLLTVVPKVLLATPDQDTAYSGRTVLLEKKNNTTVIKSVN